MYPTADELLLQPRIHKSGWMWPSSVSTHVVIICAMNSSTLFMFSVWRSGKI